MADTRTVTPREISQITNAICDKPKTILWHGKRISINPLLTFKEVFELVGEIISHCLKDDLIVTELVDFVFKAKAIEKYGGVCLPDDMELQYQVIYGSDLVSAVLSEVNQNQLTTLKNIIISHTGVKI